MSEKSLFKSEDFMSPPGTNAATGRVYEPLADLGILTSRLTIPRDYWKQFQSVMQENFMPFKEIPPLYGVWQSMLDRCRNKNRKFWKDYGGRGISVCERWLIYENFIVDMGPRPTPKHTIDRKDNDLGYFKENCRWATRKEQQRNQTVTRKVTIEGIEYIAVELAELSGLKTDTIVERAALGLPYASVVTPEKLGFRNGHGAAECRKGHAYTPENTRILPNGNRACRECLRVNARKNWVPRSQR